jgi:hypothetical protein
LKFANVRKTGETIVIAMMKIKMTRNKPRRLTMDRICIQAMGVGGVSMADIAFDPVVAFDGFT